MTITDARLAEIEARLKAATPGPWRLTFEHQQCRLGADGDPDIAEWTFLVRPWMPGDWDECDLADQHLIAHAPSDIADLVAALRRERQVHEHLVHALRQLVTDVEGGYDVLALHDIDTIRALVALADAAQQEDR